jgi:hypothetical protein
MKTIKSVDVTPEYIVNAPPWAEMKQGVIYISEQYHSALHLCLCGCGQEVVTPLTANGWTLTKYGDGRISLSPSILNRLGCRSHYIITKNKANFV